MEKVIMITSIKIIHAKKIIKLNPKQYSDKYKNLKKKQKKKTNPC